MEGVGREFWKGIGKGVGKGFFGKEGFFREGGFWERGWKGERGLGKGVEMG